MHTQLWEEVQIHKYQGLNCEYDELKIQLSSSMFQVEELCGKKEELVGAKVMNTEKKKKCS